MIEYKTLWNNYINAIFENLDLQLQTSETCTNKDTNIVSKLYEGTHFIKSRETLIFSESTCIYNNIIYPKTGKNLPCFGIDLMAFMEKKVILVFDFQHPKENYNFTHPIVETNLSSYLDNTKNIRFFEPGNHFSRYIFVRKCTVHEVDNYISDFIQYIKTYKELVESSAPTEVDTSLYIDFDTYMHKLDPVSGFLESNFGKDFAKTYVDKFLFPYHTKTKV
jgi:hypothetical protein